MTPRLKNSLTTSLKIKIQPLKKHLKKPSAKLKRKRENPGSSVFLVKKIKPSIN